MDSLTIGFDCLAAVLTVLYMARLLIEGARDRVNPIVVAKRSLAGQIIRRS